ncbi:HEAT repeat domain-containing protein [Nannocystis pusilla]|uniref:HEAT repeat domain-containing protein n=1 Tax=Nannocystis pusilla TaxID=889268 RepID=UPI003B7BD663
MRAAADAAGRRGRSGLSIARAEARREAGSAALVELTATPASSAAAIRGLGRIGDAVALARLGELLASPDEAVRVAAMQALDVAGALGSEVAGFEDALWQRWPQASPRERLAIVIGTRRLGGPAASARLAAALGSGEAPEVREAAAIVLGILGRRELPLSDAARDGLVALAGESEPRRVYAAVYGLAHAHAAGHDAGEAALLRATAAADPDARALALKGLARRKPPEALAAMRAGLGDPDPWVRVAAVRGLGELGDAAATAALWDWLRAELAGDIVDGTGPGHPVLEAMSVLTAGKTAPAGPPRPTRAPRPGWRRRGRRRGGCGRGCAAAWRRWRPGPASGGRRCAAPRRPGRRQSLTGCPSRQA